MAAESGSRIITFVDLLGIQRFVFSSNRLRDVAGGSQLVSRATSRKGWVRQLAPDAKVLVAGGGNLMLRFEAREGSVAIAKATAFATAFSRQLDQSAPGLEAAILHHPIDEKAGLARNLRAIYAKMDDHKRSRRPGTELLGLGVATRCRQTGDMATSFDEGDQPVSRGIETRRQALKNLEGEYDFEKRFLETTTHPNPPKGGFDFPLDHDHLGRSVGERSLLGVVHVDGNSIGRRLQVWLDQHVDAATQDEAVERELQEISEGLDNLANETFAAVVDRVVAAIEPPLKTGGAYRLTSSLLGEETGLRSAEDSGSPDRTHLPLRPILLGGDDLTFVCDGRIALDLAETALERFARDPVPHLGAVAACAGVALIHVHAPFSRGYTLSEQLCRSAKRMLRDRGLEPGSALDWHIGLTDPQESPADLRARLYHSNQHGKLTGRPYMLGSAEEVSTWRWLSETVLGHRAAASAALRGRGWRDHRNKVKELAPLSRRGPREIEEALVTWRAAVGKLELPPGLEPGGFRQGNGDPWTPLLDAIELMDIHWPLARKEGNGAS